MLPQPLIVISCLSAAMALDEGPFPADDNRRGTRRKVKGEGEGETSALTTCGSLQRLEWWWSLWAGPAPSIVDATTLTVTCV